MSWGIEFVKYKTFLNLTGFKNKHCTNSVQGIFRDLLKTFVWMTLYSWQLDKSVQFWKNEHDYVYEPIQFTIVYMPSIQTNVEGYNYPMKITIIFSLLNGRRFYPPKHCIVFNKKTKKTIEKSNKYNFLTFWWTKWKCNGSQQFRLAAFSFLSYGCSCFWYFRPVCTVYDFDWEVPNIIHKKSEINIVSKLLFVGILYLNWILIGLLVVLIELLNILWVKNFCRGVLKLTMLWIALWLG